MTVAEMKDRMSNFEYIQWSIYFQREAQQRELEEIKTRMRAG